MTTYYRLITLFIIIVLFIAAVGAYVYFVKPRDASTMTTTSSTSPSTYACNDDAYVCPDGTVVGRIAPACEFSNCPGTVPASGVKLGTLYGGVTVSPVCPIETNPPKPECAPKPITTDIRVYGSDNKLATTTRTNANGVFMLRLSPGTYIVHAGTTGSVFPRCTDIRTTITALGSSTVDISCDSGIR